MPQQRRQHSAGLCSRPGGGAENRSRHRSAGQRVFTRYESGETLKTIADSLNKRGLRTRKGSAFRVATLNVILKNRMYIGEYKYADTMIPDGIPAIIEPDLFERVQQRMEGNKKAPSRTKADGEYLLTAKLFCGDCSRLMVGESGTSGSNGAKYYYYKCGGAKRRLGCKRKPFKKRSIERVAIVTTVQRVLREEEINRIADAIIDLQNREDTCIPAMRQQRKACEKAIENMLNATQMGILTRSPRRDRKRQIIDTFTNAVYVCDDRLVFHLQR